jgi:phosphohistidine phosphatase
MKLYFFRHAEAEDGADDAARALTPLGRKQARELGRFLEQAGVSFGAAFSSPLVRARQTAEIALGAFDELKPVKLMLADALLNETSERDFDQWLEELPDEKHVLLVGHEPSLSVRVRHLLGLERADALKLPKGGLACVDTEDRKAGTLKFFITPRALGL